jgi:hypothetical protein
MSTNYKATTIGEARLYLIRKTSSILFSVLLIYSCKSNSSNSKEESSVNEIKVENSVKNKIRINEFSFYKTDLGAVYLHIPNENKKENLLRDSLVNVTLLLNGDNYRIKIIKQFFDKTIIGDNFFFTVHNKTGKPIEDKIDGKSFFLIGFEKNVKPFLDKAKIGINDIRVLSN